MVNDEIQQLVERFALEKHPDGGYFKHSYCGALTLPVPWGEAGDNSRHCVSTIYCLLTAKDFFPWHILRSDELWYFHAGSPLSIHILDPNTGEMEQRILGDTLRDPDADFSVIVANGRWFCAALSDEDGYAFCNCAVSPGFHLADFSLAERDALTARFPQHQSLIHRYTREKTSA